MPPATSEVVKEEQPYDVCNLIDEDEDGRTAPCSVGMVTSQRAFGVKMTSYQRRCDVITSHRRK